MGARSLAWTPTDPLAARQWNLTAVNAFGYADTLPSFADAPTTVAVIDSGIDRTSPDLAGAVPLAPIDEAHDKTASLVHGTAVAGIIAADADNGIGGTGVGVPYVKLLDYRVVSGGDVDPDIEAKAIHDAVGAGARVINLSLGGNRDPKVPMLDEFSREERDAISYAVKNNVVVVAAVGNSTGGTGAYASWPAALRHVIGVSAVDSRRPGPRSRIPIRSSTTSRLRASGSSRPCRGPHAHRLVAGRPSRHDGRLGRDRARHVVRRSPRDRGRRRPAGAAPGAHGEPGRVDPRAHGPSSLGHPGKWAGIPSRASGCLTSRPQ